MTIVGELPPLHSQEEGSLVPSTNILHNNTQLFLEQFAGNHPKKEIKDTPAHLQYSKLVLEFIA